MTPNGITPFQAKSICVVGLGYIGLPTAAMFATHGKQVTGVDVNERVVASLRSGQIHIEEPDLDAFVQAALASGRLTVAAEPVASDVFILAVPTPSTADHRPDLRFVEAAARSIVPHLRPGNLVVLESTSPPGTTVGLIPTLEESGLRVGEEILLAHSPERVLPGRILIELVENDRVIGGHTLVAAEACADIYRTFVKGNVLVTDATTAELVKLMENTYRDVNIALANELSRVATVVNVDVNEAIRLANHHPRVNILQPGPGVGGHCIAVDPWFIADAAPDQTPLIQTARAVNDAQPSFVVSLIEEAVSGNPAPVIALLGLAYKADVDDARESPSMTVATELISKRYDVRLHDPYVRALPGGAAVQRDRAAALDGADAVVILTGHKPYHGLTPDDPAMSGVRHRVIIDTRAVIDAKAWQQGGFSVYRLGVGGARHPAMVG